MTILSKLTATAAAIALAGAVMAPLAAADNRSEKRAERGNMNQRVAQRAERINANREDRTERRSERRADRGNRAERPRTDRPRTDRPRADRPRANNGNRDNRGQNRNIRAEDRVNRGERHLYANNSVRGQHDRPARVERRQERRADRRQANRAENRQIRNNAYNRGQRDANRNNRSYNRAHRVNRNYNNNRRYSYHAPRRHYVRRAPRVVYNYRNFYHTPRYSYISYNHYNDYYRSYTPRYQIGGHYGYHNNSIIIEDYAYYGLYDPPYGHHWVRDHDSGDAILASVATGAIVGLIVGILAN